MQIGGFQSFKEAGADMDIPGNLLEGQVLVFARMAQDLTH